MTTDVAIVTLDGSGSPVVGCAAYLRAPDLPGGFLFDITNKDGYALFKNVRTPFAGHLRMTAGCQFYEEAVAVPDKVNVTIRVGGTGGNPQDVHLPSCVPFV
jgi:hypothetical protein